MTDDMRPCVRKALIDLQDTWAIDSEQGEHIAELLNDAYNAAANDTLCDARAALEGID